LTAEVNKHMEAYDIPNALKGVLPFVDDASNWYIRRSRKRFWKSENDADKNMAYKTLHYVLTRLCLVLAPFTPFMAEELFRSLTGRESVHLCDWPPVGQVNGIILEEMSVVRELISQGLAQRAAAGIKVRQPLDSVHITTGRDLKHQLFEIIHEELNVQNVESDVMTDPGTPSIAKMDLRITPELKREGLARELIRHIQSARKKAGLQVDDRISLSVETDSSELEQVFKEFEEQIFAETLAVSAIADKAEYQEDIDIDNKTATVKISRNNSSN
jgi:isoleucyl-tRNA synthetase